MTFYSDIAEKNDPPVEVLYAAPNVLGAICVSEDSRRYLQWAFPGLFLQRIRHGPLRASFLAPGLLGLGCLERLFDF